MAHSLNQAKKQPMEEEMKRLLIALVAIFALAQALPAEAAKPSAGFEINHVKGTLPGGGSFSGDILIEIPSGRRQ
jgi:hypothetical protein